VPSSTRHPLIGTTRCRPHTASHWSWRWPPTPSADSGKRVRSPRYKCGVAGTGGLRWPTHARDCNHGAVSQYFDDATTGETLWNPATRVAQLFFRMTEALVPVADRPCGVVDLHNDEYAVDPQAFATFVDALVRQHLASNHKIFKAMLSVYLPQAVVMVERSGRQLAALTAPIQRSAEAISLNVDVFDLASDQRDLIRMAATAEGSMPTK
jgi:hypothetical protein